MNQNEPPTDAPRPRGIDPVSVEANAAIEEVVAGVQAFPERDGRSAASGWSPEAGNHVTPTDLRELRVALRAGERTWCHSPPPS